MVFKFLSQLISLLYRSSPDLDKNVVFFLNYSLKILQLLSIFYLSYVEYICLIYHDIPFSELFNIKSHYTFEKGTSLGFNIFIVNRLSLVGNLFCILRVRQSLIMFCFLDSSIFYVNNWKLPFLFFVSFTINFN